MFSSIEKIKDNLRTTEAHFDFTGPKCTRGGFYKLWVGEQTFYVFLRLSKPSLELIWSKQSIFLVFSRDEATLYKGVSVGRMDGWSVGQSVTSYFFGLLVATYAVYTALLLNKAEYPVESRSKKTKKRKRGVHTDRWKDQPMDGGTDGRSNTPSYRLPSLRVKTVSVTAATTIATNTTPDNNQQNRMNFVRADRWVISWLKSTVNNLPRRDQSFIYVCL